MSKKVDPNIICLRAACKALDKSTSRKMLRANLEFLLDRYLFHPSRFLPAHLRDDAHPKSGGAA
jgi:hypothetical protein